MTNEIPVPTAGPPPSPTRIEERLHPLTPFVNLWIGVVALGCTVGQAVTGVSTLAIGSIMVFAAIVIGGVVGIKTIENMA